MTLAISVDNILKTVFAHSAIKHTTGQTPALLSNRHDPALRQLLLHCVGRIATELTGIARLCEDYVDTDNLEIIAFETDVNPAEPLGTTFRVFLETALVSEVLAVVWEQTPDLAVTYKEIAAQNIRNIRCQYSRCNYRIKPYD